jgi:intraflagellar transport protein 81
VQADLERVSSLKARVDEAKGATLAEISRIVTDIQGAIAEKKAALAPAIKSLRAQRTDFASLEGEYVRARAA